MEAHHVGCLVSDIKKTLESYSFLLTDEPAIFKIPMQKVDVCFVPLVEQNFFLELVQPYDDNQSLIQMLNNKVNFYHLAFKVDNLEEEIHRLELLNYRLFNKFQSAAFNMKTCAFLMNNEFHLVELIEK